MLILLLSNDIAKNPGPNRNKFFNFMCWNLNSFPKDGFTRKDLLEAHNSIYDYDIISLSETSMTNDMLSNVPILEGYSFEATNHPSNVSHTGELESTTKLHLVIRRDLSFDESLVAELKFRNKKVFFTVLYRSPSFNHNSIEFQTFIDNF